MSKLYEISDNFKTLADFPIDTDDDLAAFTELAKGLEATFEEKAENICKMIRNFESDAEGFKAEKIRLEKAQKALENKAAALKSYLEFNVKQIMSEGESRKIGLFKLALQKNAESCKVFDETKIPAEYLKSSPDVSAIKEALKSGKVIEGAELVSSVSLRIK